MIWTEDIATEKVLEKTEYFVYCGFFKMNFWGDRFVQIAKGEFLEVPVYLTMVALVRQRQTRLLLEEKALMR